MLCIRYLSKLHMYKVAGTDKFSPSTLEHMIKTWRNKQVSLERLINKRVVPHYAKSGDFESPGVDRFLPVDESDVLMREGRLI